MIYAVNFHSCIPSLCGRNVENDAILTFFLIVKGKKGKEELIL